MLPDVRDHIKYIEVSTPLDFERRLLSPQGSIYGLFSDMTSLALFRPHARSRAIKNLYLTGSLHPPGGRGAHDHRLGHSDIGLHSQGPWIGGNEHG